MIPKVVVTHWFKTTLLKAGIIYTRKLNSVQKARIYFIYMYVFICMHLYIVYSCRGSKCLEIRSDPIEKEFWTVVRCYMLVANSI